MKFLKASALLLALSCASFLQAHSQLPVVDYNGQKMYAPDLPFLNLTCVGPVCPGGSVSDTRPSTTQVTGKTGVLPAGESYQIFSASGAGTITQIHITFGTSGGDAANLMTNSTLVVACDSSSFSIPIGTFFMEQDAPVAFNTDQISRPVASANFLNATVLNRRAWINFYRSCTLTLVNASSSATANVFADTTYRIGAPVGPASRAYWQAHPYSLTDIPPNPGSFNSPQVYLMPTTSFPGGGEVESISYFVEASANLNYLEAGPVTYTDGNIATQSGGGEDWAMCGYYCANAANMIATDRSGFLGGAFLQDPLAANDVLMYRFFDITPADNVFFSDTLAVTSANGDSSTSTSPSIAASGVITFWTAEPPTPALSAPTFAPGTGAYASPQTVTISGPAGAVICYTTDGSTPTATTPGSCSHGSVYSSPVTASIPSTLNALATESGFPNSPVATATYTSSDVQSFAFIAAGQSQCTGPATTCSPLTFTPSAGNEVVICGYGTSASLTLTLSTIGSNTATPLSSNPNSSSTGVTESCWVIASAAASAITPTVTSSASTSFIGLFYSIFSSAYPITGIDAQAANNSGAGPCPFGPVTTGSNDELMVAFEGTVAGGTTTTMSGGSPNAWVQSGNISSYPAMFYQLNANQVTAQSYTQEGTNSCASQIVTLH